MWIARARSLCAPVRRRSATTSWWRWCWAAGHAIAGALSWRTTCWTRPARRGRVAADWRSTNCAGWQASAQSRAARLLAAVELGRRALVRRAGERPQMFVDAGGSGALPDAAATAGHRVERFGVMLLDQKQRRDPQRDPVDGHGPKRASSHPREVFREAMLASAANVVAFHNHPSGDPAPSSADRLGDAAAGAGGRADGH